MTTLDEKKKKERKKNLISMAMVSQQLKSYWDGRTDMVAADYQYLLHISFTTKRKRMNGHTNVFNLYERHVPGVKIVIGSALNGMKYGCRS